jgi:hypothetical protein
MKALVFLITLFFAGWAQAQALPPVQHVNINQAQLEWDWIKGVPPDDGLPDKFLIGCNQSGATPRITSVPPLARSWPVRQLIAGSGEWSCSIIAANIYGEARASDPIFFDAGGPPSSSTNVRIGVKP